MVEPVSLNSKVFTVKFKFSDGSSFSLLFCNLPKIVF